MRKAINKKALSCLLALLMLVGSLPVSFVLAADEPFGITYYVDAAAGNDTNPGTAPDLAFKTLFVAAQALNPGDTLLIKGGTYQDYFLIINKGSNADYPITIRNYDHERVIIHKGDNDPAVPEGWHSSGWTNNVIVYLNNSHNIDISGLEIHYAGDYGDGMTPKNEMAALLMYGCSNIKVHGCVIHDSGQGILFRSGSNTIDIYNNELYGNVNEAFRLSENAQNIRIYNNIVRNNVQGFYIAGASNSTIFNNLVYDNSLALRGEEATGCDIINNTFSNETDMIFGEISGNRIVNNILTNGMWSASQSSYTSNVFAYNCYSSDAMNPMNPNEFKADPGFKDAVNKDFSLTAGSPCIRSGSSEIVPLFDFNVNERVSPADIGAYAYGKVYYVAKSGASDSNDGSADAPFATLAHASSILKPGDTLYIKQGTYEDSISVLNADAAANDSSIIIRNYNNDAVTIKGQQPINIDGAKNIDLSGLIIDGNESVASAVYLNNAANCKIYNCQIINAEAESVPSAVYLNNAANCKVFSCEIRNGGIGMQISGNTYATKIYNNLFDNSVCIVNEGDTAALTHSYINNNIFNSLSACLVFIDDTTGNTIANNIFNSEACKAIDVASAVYFYNNNAVEYNCYDSATFTQLPENADANDVFGDPGFVDAAARDYHITRGSVCIDAGNDTIAPALDADGIERYGTSDIGIFEYIKPKVSIKNQYPEGYGISINSQIKITFDDQLSPAITDESIAGFITVEKTDGTAVEGSFEIGDYSSENGTLITFTPNRNFDYETEYKVTVKGSIANIDNDTLGEDFSWTFKTSTLWGNDLVHPALLFSEKDGTLQDLQDSTLDTSDTPYGISTGTVWEILKKEASRIAAEKFYCDQANRGAEFKNFYYFYYPYLLEPVNHEADNSLQIGDNATANSYAIKNITSPSKEDYFINFDYKPMFPGTAKDYTLWSSFDGSEYDDIIVKMSGGKLFFTDGSAENFLEVPNFTFANDTWYNIFIRVKADGTVNLMVNGKMVDVTAQQIGSGNMAAIGELGCKADNAQGMAYFDNIRVYEGYSPLYHEKFSSSLDSSWVILGKVELPSPRQPSHFEPSPTYYWTAITSDLQGRMQNIALAYSMLKDNAPEEAAVYGVRARDLLLSVANWSVWCDPEEGETASLDTGYLTTGMSLAYDMIYDFLTPEERAVISKAIKEKGVDILYKSATEPGSYGNYDGQAVPANTTFVQNAAMGLGALAIGKEYDATDALNRAREIIESAYRNGCDRDGAWVEGSIYGDLAIINALPFHDADARVTGHDVIKTGYLSKVIDFPIYNLFPNGRTYSMVADSGDWSYQYLKIMEYYAKYNLNDYAAWGLKQLNTLRNAGDMLSFLWHPGHKEPKVPTGDTKALGKLFNDMGLAAFKTGWGSKDTMANLKSSKRTGNMTHHTHLDQNSIELVRGDSQLLCDPGYQSYVSGPRQDFTLATGHNLFVLDGKYQSTYGFGGQIESFYMGDKYGFSVGEAGLSYQSNPGSQERSDVPEWKRTLVTMVEGKYFVLFDDYQTNQENRNLVWQLNTQGQVSINRATSTVMSRKGNDYLGIKLINSEISRVRTEENLYSYPSAYNKTALIASVPKSIIDADPALSITIKHTSYIESEIVQHITAGTARIGHLAKSGSFPGGLTETTLLLNNDYHDSIPGTTDRVDIRLDINEAIFIESMSITDGTNSDITFAADRDADTIKRTGLGICFEPGKWRDEFDLNGVTVKGNHASQRIYMNAENGRENHNILTLLYPSGDGSMPKTEYLKDSDDNGIVIRRGRDTDLVLFHKDSTEPKVLADAKHYSMKGRSKGITLTTDPDRLNEVVLKYKANKPCKMVQSVRGKDIVLGTIVGDGSLRVDSFTLIDDPGKTAKIKFTGDVTVTDAWSASTNKIFNVADASDITLQNPDGYYDVTVDYKNAVDGAIVKQNGVIIGRFQKNGNTAKIQLQKPYNETIDENGSRVAKVSIEAIGAKITKLQVVENSARTQLGKTLDAGGDNDTAFMSYNVPGVSIVSKEPYKEVEPDAAQWSGKTTLDNVSVRYGYAGAKMYVNSMNKRNLFKVYIKYQSAEDVNVYQYKNDSEKTPAGVLNGGTGWQIASFDLNGYTYDFNGWNHITNRTIEFDNDITVADAWLELSSPDNEVDYTIVGKTGDDSISRHTPGSAIGKGWGRSVQDGGITSRTSSKTAIIYANITDKAFDYYVNIKYKAAADVTVSQKLSTTNTAQIGTLASSSTWSVARIKMDKNYFDSMDRDGLVTNILLTLDKAATVSDMWLEKEPGIDSNN